MRLNSVISLISSHYTTDELNNQIESLEKRKIMALKKSIRQSEVYQASVIDLKPEVTFVIWAHEYNGESKVEFQGKTYIIIRTYEVNSFIELHCGVKING